MIDTALSRFAVQPAFRLGCLLIAVCSLTFLVLQLWDPQDRVRFRNYLVTSRGDPTDFIWLEREANAVEYRKGHVIPQEFREHAKSLLASTTNDIDIAVEIVRLLRSKPKRKGPIKSSTVEALRRITSDGLGYCADYTQVFLGLSEATGLWSREWGMSFEDFSGNGHAFNEFYDQQHQKWIFIDPLNAFLVLDDATDGVPISALELVDRLKHDQVENLRVFGIDDAFRFKSADAALAYYRKGIDGMFLWEEHNVFAYDQSLSARLLGRVSKSAEQLLAIAIGDFPSARILPTQHNTNEIVALRFHGTTIIAAGIILALCLLALMIGTWLQRMPTKSKYQGTSP